MRELSSGAALLAHLLLLSLHFRGTCRFTGLVHHLGDSKGVIQNQGARGVENPR